MPWVLRWGALQPSTDAWRLDSSLPIVRSMMRWMITLYILIGSGAAVPRPLQDDDVRGKWARKRATPAASPREEVVIAAAADARALPEALVGGLRVHAREVPDRWHAAKASNTATSIVTMRSRQPSRTSASATSPARALPPHNPRPASSSSFPASLRRRNRNSR